MLFDIYNSLLYEKLSLLSSLVALKLSWYKTARKKYPCGARFEMGFLCVVLAVQELDSIDQAGLKLTNPNFGIKGVYNHTG